MKNNDLQEKNYVGFNFLQKFFHPPFWWLFNASAKQHDENYNLGGTNFDRLTVDTGFFWRMLQDANQQTTYSKKTLAVFTAMLYFIIVRLFGWVTYKKKK